MPTGRRLARGASRVLAEPLLHFLVLGSALFVLYGFVRRGDDQAGSEEVVVSAGRVQSLAETFTRQWSRPPSDDELAGLVQDFVREEVLSREAIALGLDRDDVIVRRRLAQKMEFLSDDVVTVPAPDEAELERFLAAHPERFRRPARFTFSQVFLDRGKRGTALERDAAAMLAALNDGTTEVADAGDSRLLPPHFADASGSEVEAQLGAAFLGALDGLPQGRFVGPVESSYGAHLVRLERREDTSLPALAEVRDEVAREWADARRRETRDARLAALLSRYRVTVEPGTQRTLERLANAR